MGLMQTPDKVSQQFVVPEGQVVFGGIVGLVASFACMIAQVQSKSPGFC